MLKTLISGLFSTTELNGEFIIELIVLVLIIEIIHLLFEFTKGVGK